MMKLNKWYDVKLPGQASCVDVQAIRLDDTTIRFDYISQTGASGDVLDKRANFDSPQELEDWVDTSLKFLK